MDTRAIAEELLSISAEYLQISANKKLDAFAKGEPFVLRYLCKHGETVYPKDLSKSMHVSSARIAAILNQMESKGWIVRSTDKNDTRQVNVTITEAGIALIKKEQNEIIESVARVLDKIGEEDAKELLRIQRKILKSEK